MPHEKLLPISVMLLLELITEEEARCPSTKKPADAADKPRPTSKTTGPAFANATKLAALFKKPTSIAKALAELVLAVTLMPPPFVASSNVEPAKIPLPPFAEPTSVMASVDWLVDATLN